LEHSGTKVAILGNEGDWVKVVAPPVARAWIESGTTKVAATLSCDAKTLDDSRALLRVLGAHPSLAKRLESRLAALEATYAKQQKAAEEAAMRTATKNELEAAITTLANDFDAVRGAEGVTVAALDALAKRATDLKELAASKGIDDANTQMRIDGLVSGIDRKKILVEAKEILAKPEPGPTVNASGTNDSKTGPSEADVATAKRRTWTRVGWIEYRPGSSDYRPYRLMKGGQTIAYLDCPTGRYDLSDFVGREVGLIGELQRADAAELRVLDIERLVILSSMR
ncbi:MAG: hypothetical protein KDC95_20995, partial [Planctomycetes bacterium]|nr:hypothetical protein [Planctomycetota bacterium]